MFTAYIKIKKIIAVIAILFFILYTRFQLLDTNYKFSFEADSEACITLTKSFYNFFKNPCKETIPNTLSSYPSYQDGDYIFGAITANIIRVVVRKEWINLNVGDGENSIVICALRWNGILFDCLSGVFLFMILFMLTEAALTSAAIICFYFILSPQLLDIDLIRIDHFYFFAALLVFYFSIKTILRIPSIFNYISTGFSVALVVSSKINFPFYLIPLAATFAYLLYQNKLRWKYLAVLFISFFICFLFLFQRWLFYPENTVRTFSEILNAGDDWVSFWGIKPYFFYHYNQFFSHGSSWKVYLLITGALLSLVISTVYAIKTKDSFILTFIIVFLLQSLILILVPKVGRYGTIIPVWLCFFIGVMYKWGVKKTHPLFVYGLLLFFLIPNTMYSINYFYNHEKNREALSLSIQETRLNAYNWIVNNVEIGSTVALYHPRISNPPVFELPLKFKEKYLYFPFLNNKDFILFFPPSLNELKKNCNYVMLNNQYFSMHLNLLKKNVTNNEPNSREALIKWQGFYDSLELFFNCKKFESEYYNYGINWYKLYEIDSIPKIATSVFPKLNSIFLNNKNIELIFKSANEIVFPSSFEFQLSSDSTFRWIDFGSYDGHFSKYREDLISNPDFIPKKINLLIESGELYRKTKLNLSGYKYNVNLVFSKILERYNSGIPTLDLCLKDFMIDPALFYTIFHTAYDTASFTKNYSLNQFLDVTELKIDSIKNSGIVFKIPNDLLPNLTKNKSYYFRIRKKEEFEVYSEWKIFKIREENNTDLNIN